LRRSVDAQAHEEQGRSRRAGRPVRPRAQRVRGARAATEHEAFDLVAFRGSRFYRIQVKYRTAVEGRIYVPFKSSWADRHGVHSLPMDKDSVDVVCVYCPDTERCYYIDPRKHRADVQFRLCATRNNQTKRVLMAEQFLEFPEAP
jgi:hypothetical protein